MIENKLIDKAKYEEELAERWNWIAEDISDDDTRLNTMLVLENSYKKMVSDGAVPAHWLENVLLKEDDETLTEAPQLSTAVGDYVIPKVMFPVIRRVMPELIANKLVSVQPLQQPTGVIYYITYRYSNDKADVKAGDEFSGNPYQTDPAYSVFYSSEKLGPFEIKASDDGAFAGGTDEANKVLKCLNFLGDDKGNSKTYKRIEIINNQNHRGLLAKYVDASTAGSLKFKSDDGLTEIATVTLADGAITLTPEAKSVLGHVAYDGTATPPAGTDYITRKEQATFQRWNLILTTWMYRQHLESLRFAGLRKLSRI